MVGSWMHRSHIESLAKYQKLTMPFSPEEQTPTYDVEELYSEEFSFISSEASVDPSIETKNSSPSIIAGGPKPTEDRSITTRRPTCSLSQFQIIKEVGKGGFARAYKATRQIGDTSREVCIKAYKPTALGQYRTEKEFLTHLRDAPYVIKIACGFHISEDKAKKLSLEGPHLLVMELASQGNLYKIKPTLDLIEDRERIRKWFGQIVIGLEHIHNQNMLHQDIKAGNILLGEDDNIRIADFGLAAHHNPEKKSSWVGTKAYFPYERVFKLPVSYPSDIFALGMVIYHIFGKDPLPNYKEYRGKEHAGKLRKLMEANSQNAENWLLRPEAGSDVEDLYKRMARKEPTERITIKEIKAHNYFKGFDWQKYEKFNPPVSSK